MTTIARVDLAINEGVAGTDIEYTDRDLGDASLILNVAQSEEVKKMLPNKLIRFKGVLNQLK